MPSHIFQGNLSILQETDPQHQDFLDLLLGLVSTQKILHSEDHGIEHWMRVERNGRWLALATPQANELIIRAFALIHDAQRQDDGHCTYHGAWAAQYVLQLRELLGSAWILDSQQTSLLRRACAGHTAAGPHRMPDKPIHPTMQCCWDADRLDIGRVGYDPDPAYFFTDEGRQLAESGLFYDLDKLDIHITAPEHLVATPHPDDW